MAIAHASPITECGSTVHDRKHWSVAQFQRDAGRVPGFDPAAAQAIKAAAVQASKSKAAKKNEKRKEKKQTVSAAPSAEECDSQGAPEAAMQRLNLGTSTAEAAVQPVGEDDTRAALEKQIRALGKKVSVGQAFDVVVQIEYYVQNMSGH